MITVFIAIFTFITAVATSFRAFNSLRDLRLHKKELNLKQAATKLHRLQVAKKLNGEFKEELSAIDKLLE